MMGAARRFIVSSIFAVAALFFPAPGISLADNSSVTLFEVDWTQWDNELSPFPNNSTVSTADAEYFSLVRGALGTDESLLEMRNGPGVAPRLTLSLPPMPHSGRFYVEIEAGVEEFVGAGDALFIVFGNVFDFRIASSNGRMVFVDSDKSRTPIATYKPGELFNLLIEMNADLRRIDRVLVNGQVIDSFSGVDWNHFEVRPNLLLVGTTPSYSTMYYRRIEVWGQEGEFEIQDEEEDFAEIPSIGPLHPDLNQTLDLSVERNWDEVKPPVDLFFPSHQLEAVSQLISQDPRVAATWKRVSDSVRNTLIRGSLPTSNRPYVYSLMTELPKLSLAYLLTGNERLGELLKVVVLDATERPMKFWIHSDLRPYNPSQPVGGLETATLARGMAMALNWAGDVFSEDEKEKVRTALREKGLVPSVRWIQHSTKQNNWRAVMSTGAYITAMVLEDPEVMELIEGELREFLGLVEDDGSYGEQIAYFSYGVESLLPGLIALGLDETMRIVNSSGLSGSLEWMLSYFGFVQGPSGRLLPGKINFGDDDFPGLPNMTVTYFLANALNQGLGTWMLDKFFADQPAGNWLTLVLQIMFQGHNPDPVSPQDLGLPLVYAFDNGVGVIRSSWEPNGLVLAIRSGGASRTGYAHDYPNRNAIALYAGGEYMLVTPGRASYRSPLRQAWDLRTTSHNTITFGGVNQKSASDAAIIASWSGNTVDYLVSEAAPSYVNDPERVRRHIVFVKDPGYFFMWDDIKLSDGQLEIVDWHMHMNNHDGQGRLHQETDNWWKFARPKAILDMYVASDVNIEAFVEDGIMHRGYSYNPGDPNEGRPGSSIKLRKSTATSVSEASFYTVFLLEGATKRPNIQVLDGTEGPTVVIEHGEYTDTFTLLTKEHTSGKWANIPKGSIVFQRDKGNSTLEYSVLQVGNESFEAKCACIVNASGSK